jgi:mono/diheme cytochrome c family protein
MHEQGVMPPFQGSREDRAALAAYLRSLHGEEVKAGGLLATDQPPPDTNIVVTARENEGSEEQP